ncbi:MAG: pilus assembly protein [Proteobacteria bacterium]|nr:pilus assembly protein [Pseudomonadota bacterium]
MKLKSQNGAAAVEFAIVLPLLILLVFGIIEFSVALYDKAMITNASREGARAGIVFSDMDAAQREAEIIRVVNNYCRDYLITFGASTDVTIATAGVGGSSGEPLTVRVTYLYDFLVLPNFVSDLTGGINLVAQTVMRME